MSGPRFADFEPTAPSARGARGESVAVTLRLARAEDAVAIGALAAARDGSAAAAHAEKVRERIAAPDFGESAILLVAEAGGEIVAYGSARWISPSSATPADPAPAGWYLTGVVVDPAWRRRGIAARLTERRLAWLAERTDVAYYFANARNLASVALHERFGFEQIARGPLFGGVTFDGGEGVLFRVASGVMLERTASLASARLGG